MYFNPRPREEGDDLLTAQTVAREISIHALVKRATQTVVYLSELLTISIHALVKRATCDVGYKPFAV